MLFIFDMGGVVTKPDEMPDFFNWLNLTPQEFFTLCTGGSSLGIHAVRFTDADSLCASWKQFFD